MEQHSELIQIITLNMRRKQRKISCTVILLTRILAQFYHEVDISMYTAYWLKFDLKSHCTLVASFVEGLGHPVGCTSQLMAGGQLAWIHRRRI